MDVTRLLVGAALALTLSGTAFAKSDGPSLQDRRQAACYNDVQRLCANAMPDAGRVAECMKDKRSVVSARCAAMWNVK